MDRPAFSNQDVRSAFDAMPEPARAALLLIRDLIFATAAATEAVGPLEETRKWGQPAYLTPATRSGPAAARRRRCSATWRGSAGRCSTGWTST